jgi:1-phosphofructokinase family hexose kinase
MIITVTINPAMDKVLVLDQFRLNETNRIKKQFSCVGGKGTHVSINLSLLGIRNIAAGIVMGAVGEEILNSLRTMDIDVQFLHLPEGNSRVNYVLVDNESNCTLISDKGPCLSDSVIAELVSHYSTLINEGDTVVISGDASNQKGTVLQDTLFDMAKAKKANICLDTSGDNLAAGVRKGPFLIKPNLDELSFLCGRSLESKREIMAAMLEVAAYGTKNIVVSCGSKGSLVYADGRYFNVTAPCVPVKNTVGCGDALLSGILAGFEQELDMETNLKQATAIAAAAAMNESTVGFDVNLIAQLSEYVFVEPMSMEEEAVS